MSADTIRAEIPIDTLASILTHIRFHLYDSRRTLSNGWLTIQPNTTLRGIASIRAYVTVNPYATTVYIHQTTPMVVRRYGT